MFALHDNTDTEGADGIPDLPGYLRCESLLDLKPTCVVIDDSSELADTDDLRICDITDVALSEEWQHVMFAEAIYFDIPRDDHVVRLGLEDGVVDNLLYIVAIAAREEAPRLGDSSRCFH